MLATARRVPCRLRSGLLYGLNSQILWRRRAVWQSFASSVIQMQTLRDYQGQPALLHNIDWEKVERINHLKPPLYCPYRVFKEALCRRSTSASLRCLLWSSASMLWVTGSAASSATAGTWSALHVNAVDRVQSLPRPQPRRRLSRSENSAALRLPREATTLDRCHAAPVCLSAPVGAARV